MSGSAPLNSGLIWCRSGWRSCRAAPISCVCLPVTGCREQNGQSWLDRAGNHASNRLTVTERFTLRDPSHLWYEATLDDQATFTRPWTIEMMLYRLVEPQDQLLEHKCVSFADRLLYQDLLEKDGKR